MTGIYETEDGQQFKTDNLKRKSKCDFCGKLGAIPDGDDFIDGDLPSISGEGINGDRADICRNCLVDGVTKEQLNEEIGSPEELKQAEVELS